MYKMLFLFISSLYIELVHVNGYTGGCTATYTTTCPITPPKQGCNDCKGIEHKFQQLDAKLDHLISFANITDLYPPLSLLHSREEIKSNWPDSPSGYYIIVDTNGHPRHSLP